MTTENLEESVKSFGLNPRRVTHQEGDLRAYAEIAFMHLEGQNFVKPTLYIGLQTIKINEVSLFFRSFLKKEVYEDLVKDLFHFEKYGDHLSNVATELQGALVDRQGIVVPVWTICQLITPVVEPYVTRARAIDDYLTNLNKTTPTSMLS